MTPATKRHAPHVVVAAGAVVAAYHYMEDPELLYLGALAAFVSGVGYGLMRVGEWAYTAIQDYA